MSSCVVGAVITCPQLLVIHYYQNCRPMITHRAKIMRPAQAGQFSTWHSKTATFSPWTLATGVIERILQHWRMCIALQELSLSILAQPLRPIHKLIAAQENCRRVTRHFTALE